MAKQLFNKFNKDIVILIALLVIGLFLRVVDINNIPKAIYGDGITLVYDAYSLFHTGHDQKGNSWPFIFELGDHRPPGYVYATIPFVAILGPSALSANAVSILSGLGIITLLYLLGSYFYSTKLGLLAAFFATISPWELSLSRGPFESHFALFLSLLGVYCYFRSKKNHKWLIFSAFSFGISSLTYPTYPLTNPLLIGLIVLLDLGYQNFFPKYKVIGGAAVAIILTSVVLSFFIFHSGSGASRVESINIFSQQDTKQVIIQDINQDRSFDSLPFNLSIYFHNRFWEYFTLIWENYIENFRPGFLLIHGDAQPRHNPASHGEIYWATFILIIGGIVFLYSQKKPLLWLILGWILIGPIATAFVGPPHALRDSLMLPPILLLAAFGADKLTSSKRRIKPLILTFIIGLYLTEFIFFIDDFYFVAPNKYSNFWAYPAKQASQVALQNKSKYNYIIMAARIDNMEFAYPVYAKLDPQKVIVQNQHGTMLNGIKFLNYDNVYIGTIPPDKARDFLNQLPGSYLYIDAPDEKNFINVTQGLSGPDLLPSLIISQRD